MRRLSAQRPVRRLHRSEVTFLLIFLLYLAGSLLILRSFEQSVTDTPETVYDNHKESSRETAQGLFLYDDLGNLTPNKLLYVGKFGLGHRLSKLVSAYHLAHAKLSPFLDEFQVDWGTCGTNETGEIFAFLFGSNRLRVSQAAVETGQPPSFPSKAGRGRTVIVRNDVQGYYAGQAYKNAQIPLSLAALHSPTHEWNRKMDADRSFFRHLLQAFGKNHGQPMRDFQRHHHWEDSYVIGLHLRAGNGEQDHFTEADRGVTNLTDWCYSIAKTLQCFLSDAKATVGDNKAGKQPVVFVSTDTSDLIPVVSAAFAKFEVPVIIFPQDRLPSQEGVSYQKWTDGDKCYYGWRSAMTDMALLAQSDLLVAASRSTFTQVLPLSQVWVKGEENGGAYRFCEMGNGGISMTCFTSRAAWLFRQSPAEERSWSFAPHQCHSTIPPRPSSSPEDETLPSREEHRVVHKVLLHLPDVEEDTLLKDASSFLASDEGRDPVFYYGRPFSRKYRGGQNAVFRRSWTLTD